MEQQHDGQCNFGDSYGDTKLQRLLQSTVMHQRTVQISHDPGRQAIGSNHPRYS
jgi:hypothetical protein